MNFHQPIPRARQPKFHEGSALRSVRDANVVAKAWQKNQTTQKQSDAYGEAIKNLQSEFSKMRRRIVGVGYSVPTRWQQPYKELDPAVSVAQGTWVYISPNNDLVTTGLTDLVSGVNAKSYPGIWEAAQDIPETDGTNYNVPVTDYPGATGTPSGSPLKGDLDGDDVYWILICPTCGL